MRYDHLRLENGLELVGEYSPDALSMAAGFFCRTGSRDETGPESGVSHFLEHMMFKGTETLDYDAINKTFDRIGAQYNAFTSEENTVYYGQVLPEFQGELVSLLSQMMRPALRTSDFEMEKKVILEEIAMYDDKPLWVAHDRCRQLHYGGHPLAQSVLGTAESIGALERDQMHDYFGRRYAPDNLTFVLAGKYDWDEAVKQVSERAGSWTPSRPHRALETPAPRGGVELIQADRWFVFTTGKGLQRLESTDQGKTWRRLAPVFKEAPAWWAEAVPGQKPLDVWAPKVFQHAGRTWLL
ncbi:MAG: insulinase family protein, partial [Armatimonadetes bacterium]|nr:insulinase family protein [Armatimonadota bacterium]